MLRISSLLGIGIWSLGIGKPTAISCIRLLLLRKANINLFTYTEEKYNIYFSVTFVSKWHCVRKIYNRYIVNENIIWKSWTSKKITFLNKVIKKWQASRPSRCETVLLTWQRRDGGEYNSPCYVSGRRYQAYMVANASIQARPTKKLILFLIFYNLRRCNYTYN